MSDARLASWLRRSELDAAAERQVAAIALEVGEEAPAHPNSVKHDDPERARGIPVVVERGMPGKVTSVAPLRTCFTCGRPPRGKRRCRCTRRGERGMRAQAREAQAAAAPPALEAAGAAPEPQEPPAPGNGATAVSPPERPAIELGGATTGPRGQDVRQARDEAAPEAARRTCPDCGAEFVPRSSNQKRCGSVKEHTGCAWSHRQEWQRAEAARRRRGIERIERAEVLPAPELDPADECAAAARRLHERHRLALDALHSTGGGPDDGYGLLVIVCWPEPHDPDYALIEAARPLWAARYDLPRRYARPAWEPHPQPCSAP